MISVTGGIMAKHTLAFILHQSLLSSTKVIVEQFYCKSLVRILTLTKSGAGGICRWSLCNLAVVANWAQERIFIVVYTLVNHSLQASFGECMMTKMELLNHWMVSVQESAKHEANL
jgi:hypothetical protein